MTGNTSESKYLRHKRTKTLEAWTLKNIMEVTTTNLTKAPIKRFVLDCPAGLRNPVTGSYSQSLSQAKTVHEA